MGLAVGHVDGGEAQALDVGGDQTSAEFVLPGQPLLNDLVDRLAGQDRDAVPGLLQVREGVVAGLAERFVREVRIRRLHFLNSYDVRLPGLQPMEHEV